MTYSYSSHSEEKHNPDHHHGEVVSHVTKSLSSEGHHYEHTHVNEHGHGQHCVYKKWDKFKIGSKFAATACVAGVMGSFLFGLSMGLLNASMAWIGTELWPCDPPALDGEDGGWAALKVSDECQTAMKAHPDMDFAEKCNGGLSEDERDANCGDCTAPNALSCDAATWLNAILNICVLVGAFAACMCAPKLLPMGIRNMNSICMIVFIVGCLCSVCAGSIASMCCARLISGFAVGMTSIYCPMWISQMSPMDKKGTYGTAHQLFITIGILLAVLIGLAFGAGPFLKSFTYDPASNSYNVDMSIDSFPKIWWRCMMGFGYMIPVLIDLALFAKVSMNTPREYIEAGHFQDAKEGLYRIYKTHEWSNVEKWYNDIFTSIEEGRKATESGMTMGKAMKNPAYRKMILIGCAASAIQQLSGINVFVTASNQLFAQAGVSPSMVTVLSVVMTALNCVMTFPTLILIEKMGRKSLMVMGIAGQCVGALLPTIGQWAAPDASWSQILSIVGIMLLVCFFSVAMGPVLWVWFTEIFPADVNNAASSALVASNWMTGIIMVFVGTAVTSNKILFTVFLVLNVLSLIFMIMFCKETKGLPAGQSPYLMHD